MCTQPCEACYNISAILGSLNPINNPYATWGVTGIQGSQHPLNPLTSLLLVLAGPSPVDFLQALRLLGALFPTSLCCRTSHGCTTSLLLVPAASSSVQRSPKYQIPAQQGVSPLLLPHVGVPRSAHLSFWCRCRSLLAPPHVQRLPQHKIQTRHTHSVRGWGSSGCPTVTALSAHLSCCCRCTASME